MNTKKERLIYTLYLPSKCIINKSHHSLQFGKSGLPFFIVTEG